MPLAALAFAVVAAPQLTIFEAAVKRRPNAANFRRLADAYVDLGQFQKASDAFARASILYGKLGDPNAAKVLDLMSRRYRTEIRLFAEMATTPMEARANWSGARNEPFTGCYLGANIERETIRDANEFNARVRRHAMFFMYRRYGAPFPTELCRQLDKVGAGLQIAFEPKSLDDVRDDDYLRRFADDARRAGIPIFLRFASEMNGDWVAYGKDPAGYRASFRLVSKIVRDIAPNVAMVWCPNEMPEAGIARYYPGADAVDWVAVNFYSVIYNDANRARGAEWRHPIDSIDYMYRTYARTHPMMVGEWAATHQSVLDSTDRPDFARTKIAQFYTALPRLYPRLKAVNWLSMNTIEHARPGRQLNNYSLLDDPSVAAKYREVTAHSYFLSDIRSQQAPTRFVPVLPGMRLPKGTRITAFVRSYEPNPGVLAYIDGVQILRSDELGVYEIALPGRIGPTRVVFEARDRSARLAGRTEVRLQLN